MYSCFSLENTEQNKEKLERPPILLDSTAKKVDLSPIEPRVRNTFIVVLNENGSKIERNQTLRVEKLKNSFRKILELSDISFIFTYTYIYGPIGFAFALRDPDKIEIIRKMQIPFISKIVQDVVVQRKFNVIKDDLIEEFTQVPWELMKIPEEGFEGYSTGKGVTVAVLDTGIKYSLKQFVVPGKQCTSSIWDGCRVKKTLDFIKTVQSNLPNQENSQNADISDQVPSADRNAPVYGLHGTHMASLIGGTGVKSPGIASQVEFFDFRVLNELCFLSRVCSAISAAIENGADIVSMSLGSKSFAHELFETVFQKSRNGNDVLLTNAVGNSGENEQLYQSNGISQDQGVISVGSFSNPVYRWKRVHLKSDQSADNLRVDIKSFIEFRKTSFDQFCFDESFDFFILREQTIHVYHTFDEYDQFSEIFILLDCSGANECQHLVQELALDRKVMGALIACPVDLPRDLFQFFRRPLGQLVDKTFQFDAWTNDHYTKGKFSVGLHHPLDTLFSPSPTSSFGPSANMEILPDISTIGCQILVYESGDGDATKSFVSQGTSNANAILAGALSRDVSHRKEKGMRVLLDDTKIRMRNTAMPSTFYSHVDGTLFAHPVIKQGAGLLQLESMMTTIVRIVPSKIEFGFIRPRREEAKPRLTAIVRLCNDGPYDVKYFLMKLNTISKFYSTEDDVYEDFYGQMQVKFWAEGKKLVDQSVIVKKYSQKKIQLKFRFPMGIPDFTYMNGYVQFIPEKFSENENDPFESFYDPRYSELSVPFLFFYGDIRLAPVFSLVGSKNAFLSRSSSLRLSHYVNADFPLENKPERMEAFVFPNEVPKYTFSPNDRPFVSLCNLLPLKKIQFDLFEAKDQSFCGTIRTYSDVPAGCSLYLVTAGVITTFGFKIEKNALPLLGWEGFYTDTNSIYQKMLVPGYYHICAKPVLNAHGTESRSREHEWCSLIFEVIDP